MPPALTPRLTADEIAKAEIATRLPIEDLRNRIRDKIASGKHRFREDSANYEINRVISTQVIRLFNLFEWKCVYCGISLDMGAVDDNIYFPDQLTIDHVVPLSKNGLHVINNVVCSCRYCNELKDSKTVKEFMADRGLDYKKFYAYVGKIRLQYGMF